MTEYQRDYEHFRLDFKDIPSKNLGLLYIATLKEKIIGYWSLLEKVETKLQEANNDCSYSTGLM